MQALLNAVRDACSTEDWSRGVELARGGAVRTESDDPDEHVLRVATRGGLIAPRVSLYPEDEEWDCECPGGDEGCEHAAAAVIALQQSRRSGEALPQAAQATRIRHRLVRHREGLGVERSVVDGEREQPLRGTLTRLIADGEAGVVASSEDLAIERVLGGPRAGALPTGTLAKLVPLLSVSPDVRLDDRPVVVRIEPVRPRLAVVDRGDGFALELEDAEVDETFPNGVARCGDTIRPVGSAALSARESVDLGRGRYFPPEAVGELINDVLPTLEPRIEIDIRTDRLPRGRRVPPRIRLEVDDDGPTLSVLPTLVYGDPPTARVDGDRLVQLGDTVPLRDPSSEARLRRHLADVLGLAPGHRVERTGEAAVALADRLRTWEDGPVEGRSLESFRRLPTLTVRPRLDAEEFEVEFETDATGGRRRVGARAVIEAWRRGDALLPIAGGGWAPLPRDWLDRFGRQVADLLAARGDRDALPASALPDLARLCDDLDAPAPPEAVRLRRAIESLDDLPAAPLPDDLNGELRDYQQAGVDWLTSRRQCELGALLADDMGLGKTLQTLCVLRGRTLVVSPTSVLYNWASEIERFRPGLTGAVYHGPGRRLDPTADVTLTTYALLRRDADRLAAVDWDTVVLDEAQAIKNPSSQAARAAFRLRARFRVALSGTPVENRLDELWSQMHFANPGLLGGLQHFKDAYARPIGDGDEEASHRLRQRLRPFVLRRRKDEVARELPPRTEMVLHCELDEEERRLYEAIRAATRRDVVARLDGGGDVLAALEALLRLRQACCHRALVPGQEADRSSKVDLLLDELGRAVADGHKALVFSQWTSLLDRVEPHLEQADVPFVRLDGSTRDRGAVVDRFQDADGPPVLLISLKAGGTGLNLTAADHVFLLDPWWNPAVEAQAADRAHRIGQQRPVMVYRLVARDTVEQRVVALQEAKRRLAEAALGESAGAPSLGRDELLELLG